MSGKLRTSFVGLPNAILFLRISREGVFQQPRLITTVGGKNVLVFFTPTSRQGKFQAVVDQRGQRLRALPFEELKLLVNEPTEHITIESRPATLRLKVFARFLMRH